MVFDFEGFGEPRASYRVYLRLGFVMFFVQKTRIHVFTISLLYVIITVHHFIRYRHVTSDIIRPCEHENFHLFFTSSMRWFWLHSKVSEIRTRFSWRICWKSLKRVKRDSHTKSDQIFLHNFYVHRVCIHSSFKIYTHTLYYISYIYIMWYEASF